MAFQGIMVYNNDKYVKKLTNSITDRRYFVWITKWTELHEYIVITY